jgi:nucleobindin
LEHFAQHEAIERKEAEREAKFQGVSVEEILKAQENVNAQIPNPDGSQTPLKSVKRVPTEDPLVKFKNAQSEGARKGEWGTGEDGYKPPTEVGDKMRLV